MPVLQFASHQSPGNIWCFHFWWRWDRSGISGGGSLVPLWCSSTSIYVGLLSSLEILFILKASMKAQFFPSNYQFSNEEVGTVAVSTESFNSASSSSLSLSLSLPAPWWTKGLVYISASYFHSFLLESSLRSMEAPLRLLLRLTDTPPFAFTFLWGHKMFPIRVIRFLFQTRLSPFLKEPWLLLAGCEIHSSESGDVHQTPVCASFSFYWF